MWRDNEPAKDQWWLPGGRVLKGETLAECAVRKAWEEVGLRASIERIVLVDETIFNTGPWGIPVHSVNVCALLSLPTGQDTNLDGDHPGVRWIDSLTEIPQCLHRALLGRVGLYVMDEGNRSLSVLQLVLERGQLRGSAAIAHRFGALRRRLPQSCGGPQVTPSERQLDGLH